MKDSRKDKFEEFFEQSLKTYGENPSDSVWEELEYKIPKPSDNNKPSIGWFLMLAIVLLFIGGYWWKYDTNMVEVQQAIQQQEIQLKNISDKVENLNNQTNNQDSKIIISKNNKTTADNNQLKTNQPITNYTKQNPISSEVEQHKFSQSEYKELTNYNNNAFPKIENKLFFIENKIEESSNLLAKGIKTTSNLVKPELESMENIPSILGQLNAKERTLNSIDLIDFIGPSYRPSFEFYNYIGTTYPEIDFQNPFNNPNKKDARNFDFGLLWNIPLNQRWKLQIGMGYTKRTIGTNFQQSFSYSNNEILVDANLFQSQNTFQINTNYGRQILTNYMTNTRLNDGQDIEAGDAFTANISLVRTQEYLNIPLLLKYIWSDPHQKLKWTIKAGIIDRIHFSVNDPGTVSFEQISHPRLQHGFSKVENYNHGNTASRFGLEVVLGAGLEYDFNENFSLMFEPTFKTNIWERTPVNPYTIGIYSGIRWTFDR